MNAELQYSMEAALCPVSKKDFDIGRALKESILSNASPKFSGLLIESNPPEVPTERHGPLPTGALSGVVWSVSINDAAGLGLEDHAAAQERPLPRQY